MFELSLYFIIVLEMLILLNKLKLSRKNILDINQIVDVVENLSANKKFHKIQIKF